MLPWMWTIVEFVNACFETIFTFMFADAFLKEKRKANWKILALVFAFVWLTKFLVSYYLRDSILAIGLTTIFAAAIVTIINNKGKAALPPFVWVYNNSQVLKIKV